MLSTGFRSLDAAIGGLTDRKDYLVYGPVGSGKTAFALNFLHAGLAAGEVVALITRRSPRMVFDHGRTFGWDFESFVADSRLVLLEYTPKVLQNTAGVGGENHMISELHRLLNGTDVQRVVFDPFTPMLEGSVSTNVAFRCRALLEQISVMGTTNIYIMDTPESDPYIHHCKDQFHGMMRLEWTSLLSHTYRLTVERSTTLQAQAIQIDFQLSYNNGMAELSEAEFISGRTDVRRKILTIVPPERRLIFRTALRSSYALTEAAGAADGMAKIAAESPDLIIIDKDGHDLDGVEVCRQLRSNGLNMPIVMVGEHLRRSRDRIEISAVGADACLQKPIDGRLLRLEIQNLLHRYDSNQDRLQGRLPDVKLLADLKRNGTTRTTDPEYFFQRLQQEIVYSSENDLPFSVVILRPRGHEHKEVEDCARTAESLIRTYDLIFTADCWVVIILAEADESGASAFLKNFHNLCTTELPRVTCQSYQQQPDFFDDINQLLEGAATSERTRVITGR